MKRTILLLAVLGLVFQTVLASEPMIWTVNSKDEVLKGEANGVSISDDGSISPAPGMEELASVGQPYIWSSAIDSEGKVYLGTGSDGKVFRVDGAGESTMVADFDELNVSALAIGKDGAVYAGTSPDGKVYRIADGGSSVYFEPGEKYIWSLAVLADGSLAVGTGEDGRIYKVSGPGQKASESILFDSGDTHIITLAADKEGNLYAGTDSEGLVLRISSDGKAFALLDSPLREIHEITIGPDGSIYALALGESVSSAEPAKGEPKTTKSASPAAKPKGAPPAAAKSRYDLSGAKSAVYRILPSGQTDIIWSSSTVSAFSVYAHLTGNGVLIGTSDKGRIYSVRNSGRETLALQTGEGQVSSIRTYGGKLFATTSNQGKLFRIGGERKGDASYESPVLDASGSAAWGRIWWRGTGTVGIQTRSGNTESPDETWSAWSRSYTTPSGESVASPPAAYIQWRAVFGAGSEDASLSEVQLSYLPANIAPELLSIELLPANVGLVPNPAVPVDPNIETSGMEPSDFGIVVPPSTPRKLYQRGAKSMTWKAEDRNNDDLVFSVYYKEVGDEQFKLLEKGLEHSFVTVDGLAFADGRYVFKVVASDSPSNPASSALTGEMTSEPFNIDNTPPTVTPIGAPSVNGDNVRVRFDAKESSSYITRAEFSVNGGAWKAVYTDDGIPDSRSEQFTVDVPLQGTGEFAIALRVFDAVGNSGSARVLVKK